MVADAGARREHRARRLLERDRDDPGALGQPLAGAEEERHPGPAPVVHVALERDEGLGLGPRRDALDVLVADVLTPDDVAGQDRQHRAEDLVLLLADRLRLQGRRGLHGGEGEHLEQVGDHHVPVGAGGFVEARALLEAQRLRDVDLHVVDVVPVPDRLEEPVGEAEGEDVLRRLLAEEVVDAEDLLLVEDLVELGVERACGGEVGAEGLLHDDPAALHQAGVAKLVRRPTARPSAGRSGSAAGWRGPRSPPRPRRPRAAARRVPRCPVPSAAPSRTPARPRCRRRRRRTRRPPRGRTPRRSRGCARPARCRPRGRRAAARSGTGAAARAAACGGSELELIGLIVELHEIVRRA